MKTNEERYIVELQADERKFLQKLIRKGGNRTEQITGNCRSAIQTEDARIKLKQLYPSIQV